MNESKQAMLAALANRIEMQKPVRMKSARGEFKDRCVFAISEQERDAFVTLLRSSAPQEDGRALTQADAMTPEGYVAAFIRNGEKSSVPLPAWEQPYQDAGLIDQAHKAGYIWIDSNVGCDVTVTPHGRTAAELYELRSRLSAPPSVALEAGTLDDGLEEAARYHDQAAADCRSIARVNADNDLGLDSQTHAIDHEIAAEDIRAMKALTRPQPGGAVAGTERGAQEAIEQFEQLGRDLNSVHPRKHLDELVDGALSRPVQATTETTEGGQ